MVLLVMVFELHVIVPLFTLTQKMVPPAPVSWLPLMMLLLIVMGVPANVALTIWTP